MIVDFDSTTLFDSNSCRNLDKAFCYANDYVDGCLNLYRINSDIILTRTNSIISGEHVVNELISSDYFILFFMLDGVVRNLSFAEELHHEAGRVAFYYLKGYGRLSFPRSKNDRFLTIIINPTYLFDKILGENGPSHEVMGTIEAAHSESRLIDISYYDAACRVILEQICSCPFEGAIKRLFLEGKVLELLALYFNGLGQTVAPVEGRLNRQDIEKLKGLKELLSNRFNSSLTLDELSREVGLNQFKLKYGFKKLFGTTVFNYIKQLRMEQAHRLILDGESNVGELSTLVGYSNPSNFSRNFRKHFGENPKAFLKKLY